MSNKEREEFEKWAKEKGCNTERHNDLNQDPLDWYAYDSTHLAWESWQAAITSKVVKLPDICDLQPSIVMRKDVMDALDKAGIRYE